MKIISEAIEDEIQEVRNYYGDFDYGTDSVLTSPDGKPTSDIFDTKTLGGFSYLRDYLDNPKHIQQISPNEYFEGCSKVFNKTSEQLKQKISKDVGIIEYLKEVILEKHKKFPMTYINLQNNSQEGMHRMYAAGELFGWNKKFPCLIIPKD